MPPFCFGNQGLLCHYTLFSLLPVSSRVALVEVTCLKLVYRVFSVTLLFLVGFLHPELGVLRGKSLQGARLWHVGERQQIQQRQHRAAFQVCEKRANGALLGLLFSRLLGPLTPLPTELFPDCMENFPDRFGFSFYVCWKPGFAPFSRTSTRRLLPRHESEEQTRRVEF